MQRLIGKLFGLSKASPNTLWKRYVVAFLILGALYIGAHWVSMASYHLIDADTKVTLKTTRQEVLNEKIMARAMRLMAVPNDVPARVELGEMIDTFEKQHQRILNGGGHDAMKPANSPRLKSIFFGTEGSPGLNDAVREYLQLARGLARQVDMSAEEAMAQIFAMRAVDLSTKLETVSEAFSQHSEDHVHEFHMVQVLILGAGLLTILLECLLIFWPGHVIARNALNRLEDKSAELAETNERLHDSLLEAKKARIEADQSNKAKSMFLANMSHELRTPLNAIIGFSSLIRSESLGAVGDKRYVEYSADIEQSGQHLLELISDLLNISQVEVGATQLACRDISIASVMEQVEPLAAGWPKARRRNIQFDIEEAPETFYADPLRLRQILLNLISNAIKFTDNGDTISIIARRHEDDGLQLIVEDTGRGFDPDSIGKLLEPFERGDDAFIREREGTGLGLSLVLAFAEMHGGTVALENVPESGARVTVNLPAREPEEDGLVEAA